VEALIETLVVKSPLGHIQLTASADALTEVKFLGQSLGGTTKNHSGSRKNSLLRKAAQELQEYFAKERGLFTIPLSMEGTAFQKMVWKQTAAIPLGSTRSYSELAKRIGAPEARRAVGNALGKNPLPIFVPCHRIVAEGQRLGGFTGGLEIKRWLLKHEEQVPSERRISCS